MPLTKEEIELTIKELQLKIAEIAINGAEISFKEGDSEITSKTSLEDINDALKMYEQMLADLDPEALAENRRKKRATRKKRADYE